MCIRDRDLLKVAKELTKASKMHKGQAEKLKKHADDMKSVDEACWKGYKAYGMKKKGGKMVPNCKPVGSVKEASAVLDANTKINKDEKRKKKEAELRRLLNHAIAMKKGRAESVEPEGEAIDERTLSSYIPSDRQGEARRANLDYTKAQLKKKEDQSTKNRGDLSKRDAGKMAKERLHNKKIMSMGEAVKGQDTAMRKMAAQDRAAGIDKRLSPKEGRRSVKPVRYRYNEGEDKAFNFVRDKLKKKYGDGVMTTGEKMKPQSAADKAKARAHQAKVDKENAAERAKDPSQGRYPKG